MPLTFEWKGSISQSVDGASLRPDRLTGSPTEVARFRISAGNSTVEVGDLFQVEGDGSDQHWVFQGDLRSMGGLASGMTSGKIEIHGDAGPRLGSGMSGGSIEVEGSAGDWAGAEMRGGSLRIRGNAGDFLGAALPGSRLGMRDGMILVDGDAGDDAGLLLRRGLIAVGGRIGANLGRRMIAGSVFGFGEVGPAVGFGMKRGTLALFGLENFEPSPAFEPSGSFRPHFLTLYLRRLRELGLSVPDSAFTRAIQRYNGDRVEKGRGEILVASARQV